MKLSTHSRTPRLKQRGFTLIELQVSICLLLLMASGTASILIGYMRQIQWLEKQKALSAKCSPDLKRVVFSEIRPANNPSVIQNKIALQSLKNSGGELQAVVCLLQP